MPPPEYTWKKRSDVHKSIQLLRNRISHHEAVLTTSNALYNGDGLITLGGFMERVQWVCTETAQWMLAEFKYTEAQRILRDVAAMRNAEDLPLYTVPHVAHSSQRTSSTNEFP
jgi:hypothetical protein